MKQIISFDAHSVRNDEHGQFHSDAYKLMIGQTAVKLGIVDQITLYANSLAVESAAMQVESGSAYTKTIIQADDYRDQLDHGFSLYTESKLYHYDPLVQESARKIMRILNQYGDLRKLTYNEESKSLTNRNTEIMTNYTDYLDAIEGTEWFSKVDAANNDFILHFGSRANEEAARICGDVRAARAVVDSIYNAITSRINACLLYTS